MYKSAEDFNKFYLENTKYCNKHIVKTKWKNIISRITRSEPKIWENQEINDAFYKYKYVAEDGYERTLGNVYGLKATILGKKPATYFDDKYDTTATEILLKYSDEIKKQNRRQN